MNKDLDEILKSPVPYTLRLKGNGDWESVWEPAVPSKGIPSKLFGSSSSSPTKAVFRLREKMLEFGLIKDD